MNEWENTEGIFKEIGLEQREKRTPQSYSPAMYDKKKQ